ncbi:MAG: hypothetical protein A2Z20_06145 [Bdellovibrionales bacterium RBG_16_40_8]|nr:MAG: hypothetical protein A2Z20_06145 [Bdellovibrionales bacterium RBG_16_40_8]
MNCPKCQSTFQTTLMRNAVMVDVCTGCEGVWLAQGEINFFIKDTKKLNKYYNNGINQAMSCIDKCPTCDGTFLRKGALPEFSFEIEECPKCFGIFLDKKEIETLNNSRDVNKFTPDKRVQHTN